jgi:energy-coupling factor transporter ATP-binding protein EcfA2
LRLPPDLRGDEVEACIRETLSTVSLQQRRATLIRHLSGGQVKRASLANEILTKPSLLFLDEVTSGLDEQTDREMMNLFRYMADRGKTVVCITHSLSNVERTCHLVVVLTAGGKLAFVGKPSEALEYFGIERLGDVYERLAEQPAEHWQKRFLADPLYRRYVADRLPKPDAVPELRPAVGKASDKGRALVRQTQILTRRYFAIWRSNYLALLTMLGQSILVAALLVILFGRLEQKIDPASLFAPNGLADLSLESLLWRFQNVDPARLLDRDGLIGYSRKTVQLMFLMAVTSFWFGCNNAAKEIVKERAIFTRERDFNVRIGSYYCSKFLLLMFFSGLQVLVLASIIKLWCDPPGLFAGHCLMLLCLAAAGVALGLAISAISSTEEMAITMIPVAVLPQIILAGVILPLSGRAEFLARNFVTAYWGNRGLVALLSADQARAARQVQGSYVDALLVVLAHTCVFIIAAFAILLWQSRRARSPAEMLRLLRGGSHKKPAG